MKTDRTRGRRLTWALLTGTSALLTVVGLSLLLSRFRVSAQPAAEVASLTVEKAVNTSVAAPGDTLTYTIRIQGTGSPVALSMTDALPAEVTYIDDSLDVFGPASASYTDGVVTWTAASLSPGQTALITFSVEIPPETTATQIENTAEVTGTGEPITASAKTILLSAESPASQIHSPNRDAVITQKDALTIRGFAWDAGVEPPFLVGDVFLSIERQNEMAYLLIWTPVVSASYYLAEEATDPQFSDVQSVYFGSDTEYPVTKSEDGTYYYRVKASASGVQPSRYSNVESVVIPWTAASTSSLVSALSAGIAANGSMTVQVGIDSGPWNTATVTPTSWGGWEWLYVWSPLPEERGVQHTIHTRARDEIGDLSAIDTITVTVDNQYHLVYFPFFFKRWPPIPYPPTLNDIANDDEDGDYTVSWSYPYTDPPVSTYTLQEAKDAPTDFVDVYTGSNTSYTFSDKEGGTYYYRVRGNNDWGPGEWSDVKSTTVRSFSYHYDFNSPTTIIDRWPIRRTSYWQGDVRRVTWTEEHDGSLYMVMDDRWDFAIASPWEEAPAPPYVIETRVRIHDPANLVAYGIIFGGNDGSPCPAYRDTGCLTHYYRLEAIWDGGRLKAGLKRIDYHEPESSNDRGKARGKELIPYTRVSGDPDGWHTWKFVVESDGIEIYFDGSWFGSTSDHRYVNDPHFGVYASANEYKPAIGRFDYYYVDPD